MKTLGEEQKKYCRQGHANEAKFLKQFHDHSKRRLTRRYVSDSIYESPLVESVDDAYFLDSADGELVYHLSTTINKTMVTAAAMTVMMTFVQCQLKSNRGFLLRHFMMKG